MVLGVTWKEVCWTNGNGGLIRNRTSRRSPSQHKTQDNPLKVEAIPKKEQQRIITVPQLEAILEVVVHVCTEKDWRSHRGSWNSEQEEETGRCIRKYNKHCGTN